jgi:hypothetical protein
MRFVVSRPFADPDAAARKLAQPVIMPGLVIP